MLELLLCHTIRRAKAEQIEARILANVAYGAAWITSRSELFVAFAMVARASATCDLTGASSAYSETLSGSGSTMARQITTNSCPNYPTAAMNPNDPLGKPCTKNVGRKSPFLPSNVCCKVPDSR